MKEKPRFKSKRMQRLLYDDTQAKRASLLCPHLFVLFKKASVDWMVLTSTAEGSLLY